WTLSAIWSNTGIGPGTARAAPACAAWWVAVVASEPATAAGAVEAPVEAGSEPASPAVGVAAVVAPQSAWPASDFAVRAPEASLAGGLGVRSVPAALPSPPLASVG